MIFTYINYIDGIGLHEFFFNDLGVYPWEIMGAFADFA